MRKFVCSIDVSANTFDVEFMINEKPSKFSYEYGSVENTLKIILEHEKTEKMYDLITNIDGFASKTAIKLIGACCFRSRY